MLTNLQYTGDVTVYGLKNRKKIKLVEKHNAGTQNLFKYFAQCLAGVNVQAYMPSKVAISATKAGKTTQIAIMPITGIAYRQRGETWETTLTVTFPYNEAYTNDTSLSLSLKNPIDEELATLDIGEVTISSGMELLVNWIMYVENSVKQEVTK